MPVVKFMSDQETEYFKIVNRWLGWGDPAGGLWFIGVEEGSSWDCGNLIDLSRARKLILDRYNKNYTTYADKIDRGSVNWPIATVTAKISGCLSSSVVSWREYRENILWLDGCKVFNGNLMSLGKPSLSNGDWPECYKELFGYSADDFDLYRRSVEETRYEFFRDFVDKFNPQAIVCFGMSHWEEFSRVFVREGGEIYSDKFKTKIFDRDRVILTRHFSNGMPDKTVDFIAKQLLEWRVSIS